MMGKMINVHNWIHDSIVDGAGIRFVLFVQGCPHRCAGCHNPSSLPFVENKLISVEKILHELDRNPLLDGITLSGGEPFSQAEALIPIAKGARERNLSVWIYTGYTYEHLLEGSEEEKELLGLSDVIVDGLFEMDNKSVALTFAGSLNQRLIDVPSSLKHGKVVLWEDDFMES